MPADQTGSNTPSPDVAADWMRQYRQQKRKCDEENGVLRNIIKRAKADGMNTKSMIEAVKATKLDPDIVQSDLRDTIRYMGIIRVPVTQSALFDGIDWDVNQNTRHEDDLWDAGEAGYRAGRQGAKVEDCSYEPGSELHTEWMKEWQKGQAAIARELGSDVKPASTTRTRPARKAKQVDLPYVPSGRKSRKSNAKSASAH